MYVCVWGCVGVCTYVLLGQMKHCVKSYGEKLNLGLFFTDLAPVLCSGGEGKGHSLNVLSYKY